MAVSGKGRGGLESVEEESRAGEGLVELPLWGFEEVGPLLLLSIVLVVGGVAGRIAARFHIPAVTGNILAGVIIGPSFLGLVDGMHTAESFGVLSNFAMGIIAVAVGGQLSYSRIHNAKRRILTMSFCEITGAMVLVFLVSYWLGAAIPVCILLATISCETAAATTLAVVRESRAKGPFVKTVLSTLAIDNILCVVFFAFAVSMLSEYYGEGAGSWPLALAQVFWQLGGALLVGVCIGRVTDILARRSSFLGWSDFSVVFVAILLCTGLGNVIQVSPLLTSLFFGVYLANASADTEKLIRVLSPIEPLLFIAFFTVAGASLHLNTLQEVGLLCAGYVVARIVGKGLGSAVGGAVSRSSSRIWSTMPLALAPQAGLAIGLVVLLDADPNLPVMIKEEVTVIILAAVTINEIIGPFMTRYALRRSKEAGLDRPRLVEFVQEEYIVTPLKAKDKWEAIDKLVQFCGSVHHLRAPDRSSLRESVIERERDTPTGIGKGVAIPHGRIERGDDIKGVLGILEDPVDWDGPDGEFVRLVMLVATPRDQEAKHLEVLQCLAAICSDERVRHQLFDAEDANEAWEVIEAEETPNYNYFLEDEKQLQPQSG